MHDVGALATGINVTRELDPQKTFVWSAGQSGKKSLLGLGLPVLDCARELGGTLAFGSRIRNSAVVERCRALDPLWALLRRLPAPLLYKTAMLPCKFWASALHGIAGVPIGESVLGSLRAAAVRALRANSAGCSAMLRLSLSGVLEADPGFYQIWIWFRDLRRMLHKIPGLLTRWRVFHSQFTGRLHQGPFSKLFQVFGLLGWRLVDPPLFEDRSGLRHCMCRAAPQLLYQLVTRDWLAHVADLHRHRKTMHDLIGIEPSLALLDRKSLSPLDLSRVHALQSGAFLAPAAHAKYDTSQAGICHTCHVLDDVRHRVCECPHFIAARDGLEWVVQDWPHMPTCMSHHLLSPSISEVQQVRTCLHQLPDGTGAFAHSPGSFEIQHLFTDGACTQHPCQDLCLASWGVIDASSRVPVSSGLVPGVMQTAPRAELHAIISAIRWTIHFQQRVVIWSDAKWLVSILQQLLSTGWADLEGDNCDLWQVVACLCEQLVHEQLWIKHVPSHLDEASCCSPFEEWVATNNNHVDQVAAIANACRTQAFLELRNRASQLIHSAMARIRGLRQIYMRIADCTAQKPSRQTPAHEDEPDELLGTPLPVPVLEDALQDLLPLDWQLQVSKASTSLPRQFLLQVIQVAVDWSQQSSSVFALSWLELAFLFASEDGFAFPAFDAGTGSWRSAQEVPFADPRVSISAGMSLIKKAICTVAAILGFGLPKSPLLTLTELKVFPRQSGIFFGCCESRVKAARDAIFCLCQSRPIRVAADLSRPL